MTDALLRTALAEVFDHFWHDEQKDYECNPSPDHIALALEVIGRAIGRVE
jgi:hypothetical protein